MSLSAELKAALAVIPEASRTIKLRGHDCTHWPIEAKDFATVALQDKQLAMALFGVDMDTGQAAAPEQVAAARESIPVPSAAKLIALSTRDPDMEALVPNMTKLERERSLNTSLEVTTGGDPQGFFEEVARIIKSAAALISSLPKGPESTSGPVATSSTVTRSSSSSKPSATSKRRSASKSGAGRRRG